MTLFRTPKTLIIALIATHILASPAWADVAPIDRLSFGMFVAGEEMVSWTLRADGTGEAIMRNVATESGKRVTRRERLLASEGDYRSVIDRLARYRALAVIAPGCTITGEGVMAYRLSWHESGVTYHASFSDNCGGIPTDFFDTMRPIGEQMEDWMVESVEDRQ